MRAWQPGVETTWGELKGGMTYTAFHDFVCTFPGIFGWNAVSLSPQATALLYYGELGGVDLQEKRGKIAHESFNFVQNEADRLKIWAVVRLGRREVQVGLTDLSRLYFRNCTNIPLNS